MSYDGTSYGLWYSALSQGSVKPQIEYATSRDGITWSKSKGNPILEPGTPGTWDANGVEEPAIVETKTGLLVYYDGITEKGNRIGVAQPPQGFAIPEFPTGNVSLLLGVMLMSISCSSP